MSTVHRPKEERAEKKTELFRIHLENTLTMDYLTGWIKKIVELPENKRPANVLEFFIENRNLWSGNVVSHAMLKAIEDLHKKLIQVQEDNRRFRRQNAHIEMLLLNRRVAALDASAKMKKKDIQKAPAAGNPSKQRPRPRSAASPKQRSHSVGGPSPKQQTSHARGGVPHPMPMPLCGGNVMREISTADQLNELTDGITA